MKAKIVVGLGFGDEGKGSIVDFLKPDIVVKYSGGCQAQHNVQTPEGAKFCFSQLGAGTLAGAKTFIGEEFIVDPPALNKEYSLLRDTYGIRAHVTADPNCLVVTSLHRFVNREQETRNKHGSTGRGIGSCRSDSIKCPNGAIRVRDLNDDETLFSKLKRYNVYYLNDSYSLDDLKNEMHRLHESNHHLTMQPWGEFASRLTDCNLVFEGSQGVLLDQKYGFHPHTTWSNVMPYVALDMCKEAGISDVETLGITRCYHTRHGNGPFPTVEFDFEDINNPKSRWAGSMRFGELNLSLLRYAVECCKVSGCAIDGLVVNGLDQMEMYPSVALKDDYLISAARPDITLAEMSIIARLFNNEHRFETHIDGNVNNFLRRLQDVCPISIIGTGPSRNNKTTIKSKPVT